MDSSTVPAEAQAQVGEHKRKMANEEARVRLRESIHKAQAARLGAPSRRAVAAQAAQVARVEARAAVEAAIAEVDEGGEVEAEEAVGKAALQEALTGSSKAEEVEVDSESYTDMSRRHALLMVELKQYVQQCIVWCWGQVRAAYHEYLEEHRKDPVQNPPLDMLIAQEVLVDLRRDALSKSMLNVLIVLIKGHVYGFACDERDGLEGWLKRRGGKLMCEPGTELEILPDDPCFSQRMSKGKTAEVISNIRIDSVPTIKPPFWRLACLATPTEFVLENITTQAEFDARYGGTGERDKLVARVRERLAEAKEEARRHDEKVEAATAN